MTDTEKLIATKLDDLSSKTDEEKVELLAPELVATGMSIEEARKAVLDAIKKYQDKMQQDKPGDKLGVPNNPRNRMNTLRQSIKELSQGYF